MAWVEFDLEWLDGPPTEPGYYWWVWMHDPGGPLRLCQVSEWNGVMCVDQGDGFHPASGPMRYWAGPMPKPENRPKKRTKGWEHG